MTDQKILEIISKYEIAVPDMLYKLRFGDEYVEGDHFREWFLIHVEEMLPKMRIMVTEHDREKLMRWLGYVQGVLHVTGIYSLHELKDHNREV